MGFPDRQLAYPKDVSDEEWLFVCPYRSASLQINSNANGTYNPFIVGLTGLGLSAMSSTGNDGLNDHAKYNLNALGFDWQQS